MAIDPKLLVLKPVSELATVNNPTTGSLLFYDGGDELKKTNVSDFYNAMQSAYLGIATTTTTPPATGAYWYKVNMAGTYTNFKGSGNVAIVVTATDLDVVNGVANNSVILEVNNGVATKVVEKVKGDKGDPADPAKPILLSTATYPISAGSQLIEDSVTNNLQNYLVKITLTSGQTPTTNPEKVGTLGGAADLLLEDDINAPAVVNIGSYTDYDISEALTGALGTTNTLVVNGNHQVVLNFDVSNYDRLYYKAIKPQSTSFRFLNGKNSAGTNVLVRGGVAINYKNFEIVEEVLDIAAVSTLSFSWFNQLGFSPIFRFYNEADKTSTKKNYISNKIDKINKVLKSFIQSDTFSKLTDETTVNVVADSIAGRALKPDNSSVAYVKTNILQDLNVEGYDLLTFKGVRYATTTTSSQLTYTASIGITDDNKKEQILWAYLESDGFPVEDIQIDVSRFKTISLCYDVSQSVRPVVKLYKLVQESTEDYIYKNIGKATDNGSSQTTSVIEDTIKDNLQYIQSISVDSSWDFTTKPLRILFTADYHGAREKLTSFVKFINALKVDFGVAGGDLNNAYTDDFTWWREEMRLCEKPIFYCIGDNDHDGGSPTTAGLFTKYFGADFNTHNGTSIDKTYYHIDRPNEKIRMIFLNEFDALTSASNMNYTKIQLDWFSQTLLNTPIGYGVMVVKHKPGKEPQKNPTIGWYDLRYYDSDSTMGHPVETIIQAFIDKVKMLPQTFGSVTINGVDFSSVNSATDFVCYLGGHVHCDIVGFLKDFPKQLSISIDCAALNRTITDLTRIAGTTSENVINHITVNKDKKTVSLIRLGANTTYSLEKRNAITIKYKN